MKLKFKETLAKHKELIIYITLGIYVAGVSWLTLVDREPAYKFRALVPFWSYGKIFDGDFEALKENIENVALFIPAGYFLRMFLKKDWKKTVLIGFCISLSIETLQLITTLGSFEPDDLLHNTLGALIGWYLWKWIPIKAEFDLKKVRRLGIVVACSLIVLVGSGKLVDYINYQRMVTYAALSDTPEHKNLLVLNGKDGYCWNTDVHVVYQEDGSIYIKGTSDKTSWWPIADIQLEPGMYTFSGLSGVEPKTVALELETDKHRFAPDVGPNEEVIFTLDETTKLKVYVLVYDGCDCNVTARPVIYKEE